MLGRPITLPGGPSPQACVITQRFSSVTCSFSRDYLEQAGVLPSAGASPPEVGFDETACSVLHPESGGAALRIRAWGLLDQSQCSWREEEGALHVTLIKAAAARGSWPNACESIGVEASAGSARGAQSSYLWRADRREVEAACAAKAEAHERTLQEQGQSIAWRLASGPLAGPSLKRTLVFSTDYEACAAALRAAQSNRACHELTAYCLSRSSAALALWLSDRVLGVLGDASLTASREPPPSGFSAAQSPSSSPPQEVLIARSRSSILRLAQVGADSSLEDLSNACPPALAAAAVRLLGNLCAAQLLGASELAAADSCAGDLLSALVASGSLRLEVALDLLASGAPPAGEGGPPEAALRAQETHPAFFAALRAASGGVGAPHLRVLRGVGEAPWASVEGARRGMAAELDRGLDAGASMAHVLAGVLRWGGTEVVDLAAVALRETSRPELE